jgi:hypothetical protein
MSFIDTATTSIVSRLSKAVIRGPRRVKIIFLVAISIILTAIIIASLIDREVLPKNYDLLAGMLSGLGGLLILSIYSYQTVIDENEAKEELKKVEDKVKENPNEPTAAWELARIKLENYLNRNLSQIQWIFIWTVITMVAGFVIIGYGIIRAYEPNTSINASIIATASGLFIEFIGATFLVIYKSTMQQAKDYVNVLERINAVGMSVQIFESISKEEIKLQDQTKAEISKQLLALYSIKP